MSNSKFKVFFKKEEVGNSITHVFLLFFFGNQKISRIEVQKIPELRVFIKNDYSQASSNTSRESDIFASEYMIYMSVFLKKYMHICIGGGSRGWSQNNFVELWSVSRPRLSEMAIEIWVMCQLTEKLFETSSVL